MKNAFRIPLAVIAFPLASICLAACDGSAEKPTDGKIAPPCAESRTGVNGIGVTNLRSTDSSSEQIVFSDNNILSFNPLTREIRFRDLEPARDFEPYRQIRFELDEKPLFTAATMIQPTSSRLVPDLVLYAEYGSDWTYYLHDGYPLWAGDNPTARTNAAARAEGWKRFLEHLEADGRLIGSVDPATGGNPGEIPDPETGIGPGSNPGGSNNGDSDPGFNPGDPGPGSASIPLTEFVPPAGWRWADLQPNTLFVVRSEQELGKLLASEHFSASGIDFGRNTLLLVRVYTPNGIYRIKSRLQAPDEQYAYSMRVEMFETCDIGDRVVAQLAPAIGEQTPVAFSLTITHDVEE